jgi:hypothetical protein
LKFLFQVEWQPMKCFPGLRLNSWQNHEKRILAAIDDFIWILIQLLVLSKCVKQPLKYGLAWWTTRPLFGIEAEINGMGWDGMEWNDMSTWPVRQSSLWVIRICQKG